MRVLQIEIFLVMCYRYMEWRVRVLQIGSLLVMSYRYMEWFVFVLKMDIFVVMPYRYVYLGADTAGPTDMTNVCFDLRNCQAGCSISAETASPHAKDLFEVTSAAKPPLLPAAGRSGDEACSSCGGTGDTLFGPCFKCNYEARDRLWCVKS